MLAQRDDGRDRPARAEPGAELLDLLADDRLGAGDLAGAPREVLADGRLQVVDVVEEDLLDFAGRRFDVARQRDVDDEERPVAPRPHDGLDVRLREDRRGRAGRRDHDVARAEHGVHVVPRRGARAADRLRRPRRMRHRPADDGHVLHALRLHVQRRELAHFARADHDDVASLEVAEDLAREGDRGEAHGHRARAEARLGPHALAHGEGRVEQPVQDGPGRLRFGRDRVRVLHLAEDLRLADDERVEARGDAEEMPRGVEVVQVVDVRDHIAGRHVVELAEELHEVVARRGGLVARDVDLGPVARRQHRRLARRPAGRQCAERLGHTPGLKVDPLTQVDRRRAMTG